MPNGDTPETLPPDFFAKSRGTKDAAPQELPPDFFANKTAAEKPPTMSAAPKGINKLTSVTDAVGRAAITNKFPYIHPFDAASAGTQAVENLVPNTGVGGAAKELLFGGQDAGKEMGTRSGLLNNPVTQIMSAAPAMAETAPKLVSGTANLLKSGEPLARINKLLGVGAREIRVGSVPESLDEFASNPARGLVKAGLDEKKLSKMNPVERLQSVTKVRDDAGTKLDQVLNANGDKTINVQKVVQDTFSEIADKKLAKIAETRLNQILTKAKITKPLSQLTPMEARTVQRGLDDFANFSPEGATKSFRDVATSLRRGISQATRKAIPETAELDQDYGDLAGATKAARRQVNKYARTVPQGKLRKMLPYLAAGAGGSAAVGAVHHFLPLVSP